MQCVLLENLDIIYETYKTNVVINQWDTTYYYYERFFALVHITILILIF